MAWLAVNSRGLELIYQWRPRLEYCHGVGYWISSEGDSVQLTPGTIEKLIGRKLTIDDGPVEI